MFARHRREAGAHRIKDKAPWSEARMRTLRGIVLAQPAMSVVLEESIPSMEAAPQRIARLEAEMEKLPATRTIC